VIVVVTLKQLARSIQTKLASILGRTPASPRAMPYTEFTFAALGRLAKASGVVRPVHIELAQQLMRDLGFGPNDRRRAILWFDYGKRPDCDFVPLSAACRKTLEDRDVLNEMALESLCVMAWSQGPPKPECRRELERLAALLGIRARQLLSTEARVAQQRRQQLPPPLRHAYQVLGVDHWIDDAELKLAYRRLMSRHHPDKLGAAIDERELQRARENSIAIRDAYDLIRANRNSV
jgi:DnaJ like chaperone protein